MGGSTTAAVDVLLDLKADLGEALTWDERTQRLWFVDINKKKIYSCAEDGGDLFSIDTPETVGTIALTTDQNLLLAAMNRSVFPVDIAKRSIGPAIATVPEAHGVEDMRFNDGKASPGGAFVVGRMHMSFAEGVPGRLYRLVWTARGVGEFEELLGPDAVGLPNGLAWDGDVMYHVDTYRRTITKYRTGPDGAPAVPAGGKLEGEVAVKIPDDLGGGPDGMCISRDGNLWVAIPEGGCIACFSPKDGQEISRVRLPVANPTCVTFGGSKLDRLYVSSMKEEGADASAAWGALMVVRVEGESGMAPAYKLKVPG